MMASSDTTYINFNPRSDERSDINVTMLVKIIAYFNPRSDERSDRPTTRPDKQYILFQSTLRRTERLLFCQITPTLL